MDKILWDLRQRLISGPHWEVAISVKLWKKGESSYTLMVLTQTNAVEFKGGIFYLAKFVKGGDQPGSIKHRTPGGQYV